jgi:hypothetical protein
MNHQTYFDYIERELNHLSVRVKERAKFNLLDENIFSESFYLQFLNLLFDWKLENLNKYKSNCEAVDLIDKENKILVQVTSTARKEKIQGTLDKLKDKDYEGYRIKFVFICEADDKLKNRDYIFENVMFSKEKDIIDKHSLLKEVFDLDIDKLKRIYDFAKKEFERDTQMEEPLMDIAEGSGIEIESGIDTGLHEFDKDKLFKNIIDYSEGNCSEETYSLKLNFDNVGNVPIDTIIIHDLCIGESIEIESDESRTMSEVFHCVDEKTIYNVLNPKRSCSVQFVFEYEKPGWSKRCFSELVILFTAEITGLRRNTGNTYFFILYCEKEDGDIEVLDGNYRISDVKILN